MILIKKINFCLLSIVVFFTIVGAVSGFFINNCIHESGHYIFAFVFDSSKIKQFRCIIPESIYSLNITSAGYVEYVEPIFQAYTELQANIILIFGVVLQLVATILYFYLFNELLRTRKIRTTKLFYVLSGLLLGFVIISYCPTSPLGDFYTLLYHYSKNLDFTLMILGYCYYAYALVYMPIFLLFLCKYMIGFLPNHIRKRLEHQLKIIKISFQRFFRDASRRACTLPCSAASARRTASAALGSPSRRDAERSAAYR